jgi:hypothetical protein
MIELIVLGLLGGAAAAAAKKKQAVAPEAPAAKAAEVVEEATPAADVPIYRPSSSASAPAAAATAAPAAEVAQASAATPAVAPQTAAAAPTGAAATGADASAPAPSATTPKAAAAALRDRLLGRKAGWQKAPPPGQVKKPLPAWASGGTRAQGPVAPVTPAPTPVLRAPAPITNMLVPSAPPPGAATTIGPGITAGTAVKLLAPITPTAPVKQIPAAVKAAASKIGLKLPTAPTKTATAVKVASALVKAPITAPTKVAVKSVKSVGTAIRRIF